MRNQALALTTAAICLLPVYAAPNYGEKAKQTLSASLNSRNPDTRKQAVQALALVATAQPFASKLEAMTNDIDVPVRLAVIEALAKVKTASAIRTLGLALDDRVPEVRFAAAKALFQLNDPAGKHALIAVLSGRAKTSSSMFAQERRDALRLLNTPKPLLILAVKQGLGFVPVPYFDSVVNGVRGALTDSGMSGRAKSAQMLGQDSDPEVVDALRHALSDKKADVRAAALDSISNQGDPALAGEVAMLIADKSLTVRLHAAACYLHLESMAGGEAKTAAAAD